MKIKKFHQFVYLTKGPRNTAIVDLLKGNVFQIDNDTINHFENGRYDKIPEFITAISAENLIVETEKERWIPRTDLNEKEVFENIPIAIEVEEGVDIDVVFNKLKNEKISIIYFYGEHNPDYKWQGADIVLKRKDITSCIDKTKITGDFGKIDTEYYHFNMHYNSCWGKKIAISESGDIRPCIYSQISIGKIDALSIKEILEKISPYWELTKDKVPKCKNCEFRYVCYDCREIPFKETGKLESSNPYCNYDPEKGEFK